MVLPPIINTFFNNLGETKPSSISLRVFKLLANLLTSQINTSHQTPIVLTKFPTLLLHTLLKNVSPSHYHYPQQIIGVGGSNSLMTTKKILILQQIKNKT